MDTITKSTKKSLLAATVVALLALVAVAGAVTYSADDSDASTNVNYTYVSGSVTITDATSSVNFFIYGSGTVTVPADVTYTGTISFGYHSAVGTTNYDVAYETVSFTALSAATIAYTGTIDTETGTVTVESTNSSAIVNADVITGTVQFGSTGSVINADIVAADAGITLANSAKLNVTVLNGKAYLSGTISAGTVTVSGTAYEYGTLTVDSDTELVVAEGATLTTVENVTGLTYDFTYTSAISSTSSKMGASTNDVALYAYVGGALSYGATVTNTTTLSTASFTGVTDGVYKLKVTYDNVVGLVNTISYDAVVYQGELYVFPTSAVTDVTSGTATYVAASASSTIMTAAHYELTVATSDSTLSNVTIKNYDGSSCSVFAVSYNKGTVTIAINASEFTSATAKTYYAVITTSNSNVYVEKIVITPTYDSTATPTLSDGTYTATKTAAPTDYTTGTMGNVVGTANFSVAVSDTASVTYTAVLYSTSGTQEYSGTLASNVAATSNTVSFTRVLAGTYFLSVTDSANPAYSSLSLVTVARSSGTVTVTVTPITFTVTTLHDSNYIYTVEPSTAVLALTATSTAISAYFSITASYSDGEIVSNVSNNIATLTSSSLYTHVLITFNNMTVYCASFTAATGSTAASVTLTDNVTIGSVSSASFVYNGAGVNAVISNAGTITVDGTLDLAYDAVKASTAASNSGYAQLSNTGEVDVSGEMIIDSNSSSAYVTGINAAYYGNTAATTSDPSYTYHYTTLAAANAVSDATTITVIGTVGISSDLNITAGTSAAKRTLVIAANATLTIGTTDNSAVMTVPASTTNTLTITGKINVVNGELKIVGETVDRGTAVITAAVFMTDNTYGIYTDLSTALATATSGTVTLRGDAVVTTDTTLASGVTLVMGAHNIVVGSYTTASGKTYVSATATLTINGTVTGSGMIYILEGSEVDANTSDATTDSYQYQLGLTANTTLSVVSSTATLNYLDGGTLVVGSDATISHVTAIAYSGAITVDGTVTSSMTANTTLYGNYVLTVNGTMTLVGNSVASDGTTAHDYTIIVSDGATLKTSGTFNNNGTGTTAGSVGTVFTLNVNGTLTPVASTTFTSGNMATSTYNIVGTAAKTSLYGLTFTDANTSSDCAVTINVTGTLAVTEITNGSYLDVAVIGTLTSAGAVNAKTMTVTDGTVTFGAASSVTDLIVTGAAIVTPASGSVSSVVLTAATAVIGTASTEIADSINDATVIATIGTSAIVYGTAANVDLLPSTIVSTALYTVGSDGNHLYATEYATGITALSLSVLTVTGQNFLGWYTAAQGGSVLTSNDSIGDYSSIYALFNAKTYTVTFNYLAGAVYLVNGAQVQSGQYSYDYGTELTVSVIAASNYDASKATIQLNTTSPTTEAIDYTVTADATFTAAGVTEKTVSSSMSITDILLIVLVVITAIVAIAVVLKLARS